MTDQQRFDPVTKRRPKNKDDIDKPWPRRVPLQYSTIDSGELATKNFFCLTESFSHLYGLHDFGQIVHLACRKRLA
jgi:hypothetical protein